VDSVQEGVRPKHAEQVPDLVRACARSCIDPSDHQLESQVASVRFNVRQSRRDGARQRNNMLRESRYNATDGCDYCEVHVVKIVCIAWGSLVSEPGPLKPASEWQQDGPALPPEFVRNSDDSAELALLLHTPAPPVPTRLDAPDLAAAREMLRQREKIPPQYPQ